MLHPSTCSLIDYIYILRRFCYSLISFWYHFREMNSPLWVSSGTLPSRYSSCSFRPFLSRLNWFYASNVTSIPSIPFLSILFPFLSIPIGIIFISSLFSSYLFFCLIFSLPKYNFIILKGNCFWSHYNFYIVNNKYR